VGGSRRASPLKNSMVTSAIFNFRKHQPSMIVPVMNTIWALLRL
jgi:hypothetical protein